MKILEIAKLSAYVEKTLVNTDLIMFQLPVWACLDRTAMMSIYLFIFNVAFCAKLILVCNQVHICKQSLFLCS